MSYELVTSESTQLTGAARLLTPLFGCGVESTRHRRGGSSAPHALTPSGPTQPGVGVGSGRASPCQGQGLRHGGGGKARPGTARCSHKQQRPGTARRGAIRGNRGEAQAASATSEWPLSETCLRPHRSGPSSTGPVPVLAGEVALGADFIRSEAVRHDLAANHRAGESPRRRSGLSVVVDPGRAGAHHTGALIIGRKGDHYDEAKMEKTGVLRGF